MGGRLFAVLKAFGDSYRPGKFDEILAHPLGPLAQFLMLTVALGVVVALSRRAEDGSSSVPFGKCRGKRQEAEMRAYITVVCVALLGLGLAGPAAGQDKPAGKPLSGPEMMALYENGVVMDWEQVGTATKGSVALVRNGFAFQVWVLSTGVGDVDKGRWRIDGDAICFKWKWSQFLGLVNAPGVEESCFRHYHLGGSRYEARVASDGTLRGAFTLRR